MTAERSKRKTNEERRAPDPPSASHFVPARSDRGAAEGTSQDLGAENPTALTRERESSEGREVRTVKPGRSEGLDFRCADLGYQQCDWQVAGQAEAEIMPQIERHGREQHGLTNFDEQVRSKVRQAMRRRETAQEEAA